MILEIGGGPNPRSFLEQQNKREDVVVLDAQNLKHTDVLHEVTPHNTLPFDDETFDMVFNSHVYEHLPHWAEVQIMRDWTRVLKTGGIMQTLVPSWEWVAREVLKPPDKRSGGLKPCAFAGADNVFDVHKNMFTVDMLEEIYRRCKLRVRTAKTRAWIFVVHGKRYPMGENWIIGVKE
jgi:predicted SAM-dependent methyltransferase